MPQWGAFFGLTVAVVTLLLALARLSQAAVRDGPPALPPGDDGTARPDVEEPVAAMAAGNTTSGELTDPVVTGEAGPGSHAGTGGRERMSVGSLLVNVAVTQGLFGAIVLGGAWYFDIPARAFGVTADPSSTGLPAIALGAGFGVVLWAGNRASAAAADAAGAGYDERLREMLAPSTPGGWAVLLGGVLPVVAVVEEFLFRAALIGAPAVGLDASPWALAVVSSVAFALGHGAQGRVGVAVTGALGFVLAAGYILSGSLLVVVVAHYLVNALEFLVHEGPDVEWSVAA